MALHILLSRSWRQINIDSLNKDGEDKEDQEEHLVPVLDLSGSVRGLQQVPDSEMLERISDVVANMDEDSYGIVKLKHVNKVIETLGSDNAEIHPSTGKRLILKQIKRQQLRQAPYVPSEGEK